MEARVSTLYFELSLVNVGLVIFVILSFFAVELIDLYNASIFALIQGIIIAIVAVAQIDIFILKIFISAVIFFMFISFFKRTKWTKEVQTIKTIPSMIITCSVLVTMAVILYLLTDFDIGFLSCALVLILSLYVLLVKRDMVKVVLGIYLGMNSLYMLSVTLSLPFYAFIVIDLVLLSTIAVALWIACLFYEKQGTLDGWSARSLRW
jgi:hypothetical protein